MESRVTDNRVVPKSHVYILESANVAAWKRAFKLVIRDIGELTSSEIFSWV